MPDANLKRSLLSLLNPSELKSKEVKDVNQRLKGVLKSHKKELKKIEKLQKEIQDLTIKVSAEDLSFEKVLEALEIFLRDSDGSSASNRSDFLINFVEPSKVRSYDAFLNNFFLYWMPTWVEIERIILLARRVHTGQVSLGQKKAKDPIKILDVGGGNGSLVYLIEKVAKTSGLEIIFEVIDPDEKTINKAKAFYDDSKFNFEAIDSFEKLSNLLSGSEEYGLTLSIKSKRNVLETKLRIINFIRNAEFNQRQLKLINQIFRGFDLAEIKSFSDFLKKIGPNGLIRKKIERDFEDIDHDYSELEKSNKNRKFNYDLIINSWMTPGLDLSPDIRAMHPAAIVYIFQTYFASGQRNGRQVFESNSYSGLKSYDVGKSYKNKFLWVGPSTPQLRNKVFNRADVVSVHKPYSNGVLFQVHEALASLKFNLENKTKNKFAWESRLEKKLGPTMQVYTLKNNENFREAVSDLIFKRTFLKK